MVPSPSQIELFGLPKERTRLRYKTPDIEVEVPAVQVAAKGALKHPLALRTEWLLSKGKCDEAGILVSEKGWVEHLRVSPQVLPRALRILDALFVAFNQAPFRLSWPEGSDKKLEIEVLGESFRFRLVEEVRETRHVPSRAEKLRHQRNWLLRQSKWDYKRTQRLKLVITDIHGSAVHYEWSDIKRRPLEVCLEQFLKVLVTAAKELKRERGEQGAWRRQWDEFRACELMEREKQKEEARRLNLLRQSVGEWAEAETLREYLIRLKRVINRIRNPRQRKNGQELIRWVRRELQSLDPIRNVGRLIADFSKPNSPVNERKSSRAEGQTRH